jgi:hypothetical protein
MGGTGVGSVNYRSAGILPAYEHAGAGETPALLSPPRRPHSQTLGTGGPEGATYERGQSRRRTLRR